MSKKVIKLFNDASKSVPAYKEFLKRKGKISVVKNLDDFTKIPITDKGSYIKKFTKDELSWTTDQPLMVYASSGSSGVPTFWYSGERSEITDGEIHKKLFENVFKIKKNEKTLVVVCFSMGLWIAGVYTMLASRFATKKGMNITVTTPGLEKDNIFSVFTNIAPEFDTVILAGYPPFVSDIISGIKKRNILFPKNLKILTAGDKHTEKWRDSIKKEIGPLAKDRDIINMYGSADAAVLGYDTPLSIFLRKETLKNKELYMELFGDSNLLPGLFQYNPNDIFFEEIDGELVITKDATTPLIRYNIHDTGRIINNKEINIILKKYGLYKDAQKYSIAGDNELSFVVVNGRTDVAITYYALNIYPEHIQAGILSRSIAPFVTKSSLSYTKEISNNKKERFYIEVELTGSVNISKEIENKIRDSVISGLLKTNIEFFKLYQDLGDIAFPKIILKEFGTLNPKKKGVKTIAYIVGRKPKMLVK